MFILPVNDDGYIGRRAYILLGLVVLNALVLAATYVHPSNSDSVILRYGFVPSHAQFSTLLDDGQSLLRPNLRKSTHATIKNGRLTNRNASSAKKDDTRRTTNALIQRI